MKAIISIIAVFIISTLTLSAQEMFVASGSVGSNGKASLCYVIGGIVMEEAAPVAPVVVYSRSKKLKMTTETEEIKIDNDIALNIFPNPAKDFMNVQLSESFTTGKVTIFDMSSSIVSTVNLLNQYSRIDISDLTAGVYLVRVEDQIGKFSEIKRIVKN